MRESLVRWITLHEPVDASVLQVGGELLHEEVTKEPAEHPQHFERFHARPDVKTDQKLDTDDIVSVP